jgi:NOL1/NOP2/sun family putative RNA methylase
MLALSKIPKSFKERFQLLLGPEFDAFLKCLEKPLTHFVRVNTLKIPLQLGINRLKELNILAEPLPWFSAGLRVSGDYETLPHTIEYGLGYYYIQEGASMVPPIALAPHPNHIVLDLCAAPGSKTTQIAQMMQNKGVIICNDRNFRRITILGHNLQLCGVTNAIVLCQDGRMLSQNLQLDFDRVLVDAPCTASGHLRSKPPQFDSPNEKRIAGLQALQKGLLTTGFRLLKPGGFCVYSTCSLHPEENEDVVQHLLRKFPEASLQAPPISGLKSHPGLTTWADRVYDNSLQSCLRIYPHDNNTDGFFLALIHKNN